MADTDDLLRAVPSQVLDDVENVLPHRGPPLERLVLLEHVRVQRVAVAVVALVDRDQVQRRVHRQKLLKDRQPDLSPTNRMDGVRAQFRV